MKIKIDVISMNPMIVTEGSLCVQGVESCNRWHHL